MATKQRFQRSTKGENAEVIVAKAIAYTTDATPTLFQANAPEGEVGLYNADTGALLTTALAEGTNYFAVIKRDGQSFRSTVTEYHKNRTRRIAYSAPVKQVTTLNFNAAFIAAYTPAIGDDLSIGFIELTPGNEPYPTVDYDATVDAAGATVDALLTKIVARINNPLDLVHADDGLQYSAVKASDGAGGFNITVTAFYFQQYFRVMLRGPLAGGTITYTTNYAQGAGDSLNVSRNEDEGLIYAGVTTNYPGQYLPEEFGKPTKFTVDGLTYNTYHIDPLRISKEPMPQGVHHHWAHIYLHIPVPVGADAPALAASSPDLAIKTVLGL